MRRQPTTVGDLSSMAVQSKEYTMELVLAETFAFGYTFIECAVGAVVLAGVVYVAFRLLGR